MILLVGAFLSVRLCICRWGIYVCHTMDPPNNLLGLESNTNLKNAWWSLFHESLVFLDKECSNFESSINV